MMRFVHVWGLGHLSPGSDRRETLQVVLLYGQCALVASSLLAMVRQIVSNWNADKPTLDREQAGRQLEPR